ncbi:hypothetical protein BKA69DRAFT_257364 [Paraphysoderma sedebokerense]|nr:hypothetical protein BKA69DRAFT_257364 [Paraphysoderma sedebokerense]
MEGLESINTILEFFRQLNSLSDTAFHLQHDQVSADVVRSELLGLFIREFLTAIPDHALSSPRYRNNECESEIFTAISTVEYDDLFPRKPIATPVIVLAKDLLTMARPHTLNEEFWKILEHLIRVGASCSGSMDTLYTFLCLIELRIENMEDSDSALMLWSLVATYLRQHAEKSNQINDNLDPENFEEDPEFIYTPLLVPLQIICSVGTRFTDSQLTEWRNLFCSLHKVTQASHKNQNHVVEKISEAFLKLLKNYESEIEEVQAGACRSIIDCYYTVSLAVKFPTSLDSQSPANGLGQRRNSRNKM